MSYSDSIDIACSPEEAFKVVTDLPNMGHLSPENTGGEWIGGATGPAVGASFKGTNSREKDSWFTVAKVVTYEPPKKFVFDIRFKRVFKVARWEFDVESAPGGCRVTETWTDHRSNFARKQSESEDFKRADYSKVSIRTTLENLKKHCEGHGLPDIDVTPQP
jgi:hypothetical protein